MDLRNYTYQSDFAKKHFAQGYREMLRKLLQQRFSALSAAAIARLEEADVDTMKAWGAGSSLPAALLTSSLTLV